MKQQGVQLAFTYIAYLYYDVGTCEINDCVWTPFHFLAVGVSIGLAKRHDFCRMLIEHNLNAVFCRLS